MVVIRQTLLFILLVVATKCSKLTKDYGFNLPENRPLKLTDFIRGKDQGLPYDDMFTQEYLNDFMKNYYNLKIPGFYTDSYDPDKTFQSNKDQNGNHPVQNPSNDEGTGKDGQGTGDNSGGDDDGDEDVQIDQRIGI